jgi:hypothetical protein
VPRAWNFGKTLILGVAIAAVHYFLTFTSIMAIAFSAVGGTGTRIPYDVLA